MVPPELTFWSSRVTIGHRAPVYMLESPVGDKAPEACVPSSPSSTPAIWGISPNLSGILFLFREVRWLDQICSKLPSNSYQIWSSMNLSWMNQSILNLPAHSFQTVSQNVTQGQCSTFSSSPLSWISYKGLSFIIEGSSLLPLWGKLD